MLKPLKLTLVNLRGLEISQVVKYPLDGAEYIRLLRAVGRACQRLPQQRLVLLQPAAQLGDAEPARNADVQPAGGVRAQDDVAAGVAADVQHQLAAVG